jgi:hypothetical protein
MNKPNGARSSLVLAVSLLLAAALSPTSLAASEQPRPVSAATTAFALNSSAVSASLFCLGELPVITVLVRVTRAERAGRCRGRLLKARSSLGIGGGSRSARRRGNSGGVSASRIAGRSSNSCSAVSRRSPSRTRSSSRTATSSRSRAISASWRCSRSSRSWMSRSWAATSERSRRSS